MNLAREYKILNLFSVSATSNFHRYRSQAASALQIRLMQFASDTREYWAREAAAGFCV